MKYANVIKATLASATILAGAGAAMAADAPIYDKGPVAPIVAPTPELTWNGFYAGLFAGYAWGEIGVQHPRGNFGGGPAYFINGNYDLTDTNGFYGGGQVGYNWQSGSFVYGVEAELGYMGIDDSNIDPNTPDLTASSDGNFYSALTGRLGFATQQMMIYAKGGVAFLNSDQSFTDSCGGFGCPTFNTLNASGDDWQTGYTVGAGVEYAINDAWSAKVEYMYFDFGDQDVTGLDGFGNSYSGNFDTTAQTVKLGVNYRF